MDGIKDQLSVYKTRLMEWLDKFTENKEALRTYYSANYFSYMMFWENDYVDLKKDDFEKLFEHDQEYINLQIEFIDKLLALDIVKENRFSQQMQHLVLACTKAMKNELSEPYNNELLFDLQYKTKYNSEYISIIILSRFSECDKNIVLIGGNGSGKSTLAKAVKGNDTENIAVIPAQKTLYFSLNDTAMLSTRMKDLEELLLENNIEKSKEKDDYSYLQFQNNQFTKLIVAMREQYVTYLMSCEKAGVTAQKKESIFGQLREIFEVVFPHITLHFDHENIGYLCCEKNGQIYHVNALSEGEKAVIYYSASVLMAKQNSFIVVDEPETYLNPSLVNVLWDYLISVRKDCQFIFITHSVDFVLGRSDSQIAWIKKFIFPNEWEFDFVDDNFDLPKTMITEVLGTQKDILFCEGDDKNSLDYAVYRELFGKEYTVIPVGGHLDVIKSCEVISNSTWISRSCKGIIDGDNHTDEKIEELKEKNIITLPFNEIEMLLMSDEIMEKTIGSSLPLEKDVRIAAFKKAFWKLVEKEKEDIVLKSLKTDVDEYLASKKIESSETVSKMKDNLNAIASYDVEALYNSKIDTIDTIIHDGDYEKLLLVCNLKRRISRELANKHLDSNYEQKALQQIIVNQELKDDLKSKYFEVI